MSDSTTILYVADSRAEVRYHFDGKGKVVVDRVVNLEHGNSIQVTTIAGSAFDDLATDCAATIEAGRAVAVAAA